MFVRADRRITEAAEAFRKRAIMGKVRILYGSWNVNAKEAPVDLSKWLCKSAVAPDIVAVSLQEIVPLNDVKQYFQSRKSEEASEGWCREVLDCLNGHGAYKGVKYSVLANAHMVGLMNCVLIKESLVPRASKVMIGYFACGRFGVLGNKGGVGIRFRLQTGPRKHKTMCFVGSHLSAHQSEVAKRNSDFNNINSGMTFHVVDATLSSQFISRSSEPLEKIVGTGKRKNNATKENTVDFAHKGELVAKSFGKSVGRMTIVDHDLVSMLSLRRC